MVKAIFTTPENISVKRRPLCHRRQNEHALARMQGVCWQLVGDKGVMCITFSCGMCLCCTDATAGILWGGNRVSSLRLWVVLWISGGIFVGLDYYPNKS